MFKSRTDTEVILYLYEKFGVEFIKKLNGDFAIAILDKRCSKLFLIRDRLGVKPIYYYFNGKTLIFASEIKAFLETKINFSLSWRNIQNYFVFKYVPGHNTIFSDIYRVMPGHYLEYDFFNNKLECKEYWKLKKKSEYQELAYPELKNILYELLFVE